MREPAKYARVAHAVVAIQYTGKNIEAVLQFAGIYSMATWNRGCGITLTEPYGIEADRKIWLRDGDWLVRESGELRAVGAKQFRRDYGPEVAA